ncbi:MAG: hypothetical protein UT24_C0009G0059 [Candidatus Woesebacteria bacterium GW2011_GWB1_39_12]|uniref:Prepilin-type N-terminal cleavage/methylation domain-containing protein n=2 Tax=Candidatus Woeseibacteriota TaxID=1752722 RepID=A0A0G0PK93_9BACT|nr:MAG: hypothetical protein UT23_C0002G0059 [Candidatus Woesebacteria bacterium GW2011_GWA1_39_12]KKR00742.1 MAG: hypothetical protein UT24_C0009G0059 [Candidatus Woesebacteria bacterium GW2011_GWB1_39_12]
MMNNSKFQVPNSKFSRGFTLVELILYIAIVTMFMTGVIYFTSDIVYGRVRSQVHQEVNQNMRLAVKIIMYEIRNASGVNSVSASSISLASTDAGRNPTVIDRDVSSGRLRIGYGGNQYFLTSNKVTVTALNFTDFSTAGSTNVRFSITIEATGDRQEFQKSETYETSVELRSQ